ncbi:AraC family transcriptional regulator [Luteolibacter sp. LG18]|uniref:AraC family transcriptional regulator n=1 Tax=Luteolibacter sp. LG18 TaxID=2819286 RepID=UPI002B2EFDE9|nr:transcriptional regulator [Luteolibacter sp. LG18]
MDDPRISKDNQTVTANPVQPLHASHRVKEGFAGQRLLIVPPDRIQHGSRLPVVKDLQVTHIGHYHSAPHHYVHRRKGSPQAILIYCLDGCGYCETEGNTVTVGPGQLLVLPAGMPHAYFADEARPWSIFWIHFTGQRATDHLAALTGGESRTLLEIPEIEILRTAFEETYRHALDGFSDAGLLGLTTGLSRLIGLARIYSASGNRRSRETEDRILKTIRRLQAEPTRDWQVEELATLAGMSPPHFHDRFHQQAGCPPKQFLIRLRLQTACALMLDPGLTIAEISRRVGYEDPYYFSRLFRRHLGQSPAAYRREIGGKR